MLVQNVTTRLSLANYCTMQFHPKSKANSFMKVMPMPHAIEKMLRNLQFAMYAT